MQISAANVVVLRVNEYPTPYIEDETGAHENELTLTGTGQAYVFRDGFVLKGMWERPSLSQPATFVEADGAKMNLTPGNTWEELLPTTGRTAQRPSPSPASARQPSATSCAAAVRSSGPRRGGVARAQARKTPTLR